MWINEPIYSLKKTLFYRIWNTALFFFYGNMGVNRLFYSIFYPFLLFPLPNFFCPFPIPFSLSILPIPNLCSQFSFPYFHFSILHSVVIKQLVSHSYTLLF